MKRKNFITTALLAIPALSFANRFGAKQKGTSVDRPIKNGFIVRTGESRYGGKTTKPTNAFLHCKISSVDTDGKLFIQTSTPTVFKTKGGPPPHIHKYEDEIIYIVSGEFVVYLNGKNFTVKSGDTVFIPRGTLHMVTNPIENNPGTLITIFQPAPKKVEDFFNYISVHGDIPKNIVPEGW